MDTIPVVATRGLLRENQNGGFFQPFRMYDLPRKFGVGLLLAMPLRPPIPKRWISPIISQKLKPTHAFVGMPQFWAYWAATGVVQVAAHLRRTETEEDSSVRELAKILVKETLTILATNHLEGVL
jgi:hypothetical protein